MIKLYNKEIKYKTISNYIYEFLRNINIKPKIVNTIETDDTSLYIIIGGEYLIITPINYIIYQSLPTSNLTISRSIEAYWYDQEYIDLLKGAKYIIDSSNQNIKVWQEFYKFTNSFYFDINYQSCFLLENYKSTYNFNSNSPIYLSKNSRSNNIYNLYQDKYPNLKELNSLDYYKLVKEIKDSQGIFIWVNQFEQTIPNLEIIYLLRYNNIPCIVEKSVDKYINDKCYEIGVYLENYIRIEKYLGDCLRKMENSNASHKKSDWNLDQNIVNLLYKYNPDDIKIKKTKNMFLYDRLTIPSIDFEILPDGGITLKFGDISDEDLPMISICTPTADRRSLFTIAIYNFLNFIYPKNKLEWVILDDGVNSIKEIIPNDNRINYIYDNKCKLPISDKRNKLVELASNDIIVFMDDDDYYAPESLLARVKSLIKYREKGIECVGCNELATYDLIKKECAMTSNGPEYLCESSLAFTRNFWLTRKFKSGETSGEFRYFLEYRQEKLLTIPFQFITIAITHKTNSTGKVRSLLNNKDKNKEDIQKIMDILGEEFMLLLKDIKKFI